MSWDITKMRGPAKGIWYHAYIVLDIFSRYIVAWRIEGIEDGNLATDMIPAPSPNKEWHQDTCTLMEARR